LVKTEHTGRRILRDQSNDDKPLVVSMAKARVLLDCGMDQLYALIKAGELDSYVEGTRRKITTGSIEQLIRKRLAATAGEFQRCSKAPPKPSEETRRKIAAAKERKAALNDERAPPPNRRNARRGCRALLL
jgi:hypothetical protein